MFLDLAVSMHRIMQAYFVQVHLTKAILKKMSVGGNISDKKVNRREGIFYFFKEHFQIFCKCGSY